MDQKRISIQYAEAPGYRKIAATGVWGGPTPSGDLLCNFFIESGAPPKSLIIDIGSKGEPIEKPLFEEGKIFIRELQVGILLNPGVAKAVGEWLIKRADELFARTSILSKGE